ncbi:MAG: methionyl-tRNA formyltransferase [Candidatus Omnitrophota bacterium]
MKIIFFGTSDFAVPSLERIMGSDHELSSVVTQPDRKKGRHLVLTPPPVKESVGKSSIPLHQPLDASSPETVTLLKKYGADLFVVVEFGQILKKNLLEVPNGSCVNLHASLLPKYRGASPINWALVNGEKVTGVTTMKMVEKMDAGDVILQREADIKPLDTGETLKERLAVLGAELLMETIDLIASGKAAYKKQDEKEATYAPKLKKEDGLIDWSKDAREIENRVRGFSPWPSAYTHWNGNLVKIWKAESKATPQSKPDIGKILRLDDGIVVGTGKGELSVKTLQLEGGKRLDAASFLNGHKLRIGDKLQ